VVVEGIQWRVMLLLKQTDERVSNFWVGAKSGYQRTLPIKCEVDSQVVVLITEIAH